jgi:type VI secretion system protein ImpM
MTRATVGFFGKLPSHGDFLERRIAPAFREVWDEWLQQCVAVSRAVLEDRWLDIYLTSPVWRFFVSDGVAAAASYGGILIPSVDRVGRHFPLTIVAELPAAVEPLHFAYSAERWLRQLEELAIEALQAPDFDLQEFEKALGESAARPSSLQMQSSLVEFSGAATHWRYAISSVGGLAPALASLSIASAQRALRPMSLWWTDGSELVRPSALLVRSLPDPASFPAMLAGTWAQEGWSGDVRADDDAVLPADRIAYSLSSAGVTSAGTVRAINQDNLTCNDQNRVWAVADGMGGGQGGEVASQMVADVLVALEPTATLNAVTRSVRVALERVNADLYRRNAGRFKDEWSASTVVALTLRGQEWAVAWAGDSRAYLFRDSELVQLTVDHSLQNHPVIATDDVLGPTPRDGVITRAVGAEQMLRLDQVSGKARAGDRFLLCSDGLYGALDLEAVIGALGIGETQKCTQALLDAALLAGASDNVTAVVVDVQAKDRAGRAA